MYMFRPEYQKETVVLRIMQKQKIECSIYFVSPITQFKLVQAINKKLIILNSESKKAANSTQSMSDNKLKQEKHQITVQRSAMADTVNTDQFSEPPKFPQ